MCEGARVNRCSLSGCEAPGGMDVIFFLPLRQNHFFSISTGAQSARNERL